MNKLKYILPVLIAIACFGLQQVKADVYSFDLTGANFGGFTGPYATVTVDRTSTTTATITFQSLTNNGNIYLFGGQGAVAVNLNVISGTTSTTATASNSGTGFTPGSVTFAGPGNEDGFGSFNDTYDSFDGYQHSSDMISFNVTNTSGTWASATDVLALNGPQGSLAAAHIFVTTSPANASNGAIITGYAAGNGLMINPLGTVPDGGTTVMLLGAALGAIGMARRYLKS